MGRHAPSPAPRRDLAWRERLVLALVAATAGGLVVGWANASWTAAGITALAVGALVLVAAWLAGTLPPPPSNR